MKRFIILFLVIISCKEIFSQDTKTSIGIEFTPTLRTLYGNTFGSLDKMALGFSGGLNLQFNVKSNLAIKSGITFERKGTAVNLPAQDIDPNLNGNAKYKINVDYLVLPILGSISNRKGNFYFLSGPYLGYLISWIEKHNSIGSIPEGSVNYTEGSKRLDFGWILGFGYIIKLNEKVKFDLGIRENLGLVNLSFGENTIKTNSFGFRVGLTHIIY